MRYQSENRLKTPTAFSRAFEHGYRVHLKLGMYLLVPNTLGIARLGLVIAKKKLRQAVKRNYVKRLQREVFRQYQASFLGYDIVFVAGQKISQLLCQNDGYTLCQADWQLLVKRLPRS
ncbi:MAG: rnpA [Gammaproteobacteria bacterium]|nr:rnpA [Gammaproteobacteria bacterium]